MSETTTYMIVYIHCRMINHRPWIYMYRQAKLGILGVVIFKETYMQFSNTSWCNLHALCNFRCNLTIPYLHLHVCLYCVLYRRLSSVSSTDALSPCDLSEALSPPFTPGLATGPDVALTPSHTHSPLISPPPTISSHKPTFIVTPDLHPKYLLADFALPCKKVHSYTLCNYMYVM